MNHGRSAPQTEFETATHPFIAQPGAENPIRDRLFRRPRPEYNSVVESNALSTHRHCLRFEMGVEKLHLLAVLGNNVHALGRAMTLVREYQRVYDPAA